MSNQVLQTPGEKGVIYLGQRESCSFTVTQENVEGVNCQELQEVLLSPCFYRFTA